MPTSWSRSSPTTIRPPTTSRRSAWRWREQFPGVTFYFLPADMITQILNFGLPSPIDVQIDGTDINGNRAVADRILEQVRAVPGVVDARIQQDFDYPMFEVNVDRTKAQQDGLTERDVATSVLDTLSGSFQTAPMFFLNWKNGVNYNLAAQTPQYDIQSLQDLQNIPVTGPTARTAGDPGRCRHHHAVAGDGGRRPLQHPPRGRHLRQRAGARSRRRRPRHRAHRRCQPPSAAARQLRHHPRPARDDARRLYRPARRPGASRSCSSIC